MRKHRRGGRAGFTLIELLVIISILAVLMALAVPAIWRVVGGQTAGTTRTLLTRLENRLANQMTYFADRAREAQVPASVLTLARGNTDLARVIYVKMKLKADMPTTFAEALSPAPGYVGPNPAYVAYLARYGVTAANYASHPIDHQSAACLAMVLARGQDAAGDQDLAAGSALKDVNGVPCLVDAWGSPLIFCRWPVGEPPGVTTGRVQGQSLIHPAGAPNGFDDPGDPRNLLRTLQGYPNRTGTAYGEFASICHDVLPRTGANALPRPKIGPVVLSIGRDKASGVNPLTLAVTNQDQANDNLLTDRYK